MTVIPDSIEPYIGYKWLVADREYLRSNTGAALWPHRKPLQAKCMSDTPFQWKPVFVHKQQINASSPQQATASPYGHFFHIPQKPPIQLPSGMEWSWEACPHEAPLYNCSCGIYAVDDPDLCYAYSGPDRLLVKVACWGVTIPGTQGVRAQYAYPQEIHAPEGRRDAELIAHHYGIPVVWHENITALVPGHTAVNWGRSRKHTFMTKTFPRVAVSSMFAGLGLLFWAITLFGNGDPIAQALTLFVGGALLLLAVWFWEDF